MVLFVQLWWHTDGWVISGHGGHIQAFFWNTGTRKRICWMPDKVPLLSHEVWTHYECLKYLKFTISASLQQGTTGTRGSFGVALRKICLSEFCRIHPAAPPLPSNCVFSLCFLIYYWNCASFHFSHGLGSQVVLARISTVHSSRNCPAILTWHML